MSRTRRTRRRSYSGTLKNTERVINQAVKWTAVFCALRALEGDRPSRTYSGDSSVCLHPVALAVIYAVLIGLSLLITCAKGGLMYAIDPLLDFLYH